MSDGCTLFFQNWFGVDLTPCCYAHDLAWFLNPGNWAVWVSSNLELGACFVGVGAPELAAPAIAAVFSIGALLFATKRRRRP